MDTIKSTLFSPSVFKSVGSYYTVLTVAIITGIIFSVMLYSTFTDVDEEANAPGRIKYLLFFLFVITAYLISLAISIYSYFKPIDA